MSQKTNRLIFAGMFGLLGVYSCGKIGPKNKGDQLSDRLKAKGKAPVAQELDSFDASPILNSPDKTCEFMVKSVGDFSSQYLSDLTLDNASSCEKVSEGHFEYPFSLSRKGLSHDFVFRVGHNFKKPDGNTAGFKQTEVEFRLIKNGSELRFNPEDAEINILATNLSHIGATLEKYFNQKVSLFNEQTCFNIGRFLLSGGNSCYSNPFKSIKGWNEFGDIQSQNSSDKLLEVPDKFIGSDSFANQSTGTPAQLVELYDSFYNLLLGEIPEGEYQSDSAKRAFAQLFNNNQMKNLSDKIGLAVFTSPSKSGSLTESKLNEFRMAQGTRTNLVNLVQASDGGKLTINYKEFEVLIEFPFGYTDLKRSRSVVLKLNWTQVNESHDVYLKEISIGVLPGNKVNELVKPGVRYLSTENQFKELTKNLEWKATFLVDDDQLHPDLPLFFAHLKNWINKSTPVARVSAPVLPENVRSLLDTIVSSTATQGSQYQMVGLSQPTYDGASLKGKLTGDEVLDACKNIPGFQVASEGEYQTFSDTHLVNESQKSLLPLALFHLSRVHRGAGAKLAGLCVKKSEQNSLNSREEQLLQLVFLQNINSAPAKVLRGHDPIAVADGKILGNGSDKNQVCTSLTISQNNVTQSYTLATPEDVQSYLYEAFIRNGRFDCLNKQADTGHCENFETDPVVTLFKKLTGVSVDLVDSDTGNVIYGLREDQVLINGVGQPYSENILRTPNIASNVMSDLFKDQVFFCKRP